MPCAAGHRGTADAPGGAARPQTHRVVQGLSLSGRQLENGTKSSGEGRVPCCRVVSATGVHRDQPRDAEPGGSALLQQTGYGGTMDQGGKAGGQDDASFLSSFSLKPSAAGAEPAGLQPGESVASAGTPAED